MRVTRSAWKTGLTFIRQKHDEDDRNYVAGGIRTDK